jgi:hypothetical protein
MFAQEDVRTPPVGAGARRLWRRICTSNPFYVISAGLFLAGLRISFGRQAEAIETWALMGGLAGYTLLLALTACLLVRFAHVWDDMRTVLLLVVLMFLATSVTFDEVLIMDPDRGFACYLIGLGFAIAVSESLLRAIHLTLPLGFRLPYYLILALFFLYPLGLSPLVGDPRSETLMWALFGFSGIAGLVFLTLLPAISRGADYLRDNGSPWVWPWYPWPLFVILACAVPARAFLLCWSMQILDGPDSRGGLIFGPYFLVPFGFALAILLLHIGIKEKAPLVRGLALFVPAGLVAIAQIGAHEAGIFRDFVSIFTFRVGVTPLYLTLGLAALFYQYAWIRRVRFAMEGLTATFLVAVFISPTSFELRDLVPAQTLPLLAAAAVQMGVGIARRQSFRCLLGGLGFAAAATVALPIDGIESIPRPLLSYHFVLFTVFVVGWIFSDQLAEFLRTAGAMGALLACVAVTFFPPRLPERIDTWTLQAYPLAMAVLLAAYGLHLRHRPSIAIASMIIACWVSRAGWSGYVRARQLVSGLDYLALSLAVFVLAFLVSLSKSQRLRDMLARRATTPEVE